MLEVQVKIMFYIISEFRQLFENHVFVIMYLSRVEINNNKKYSLLNNPWTNTFPISFPISW